MPQQVTVDSAGTTTDGAVRVRQSVLEVFEGDVLLASWEARVSADDGSVTVDAEIEFFDGLNALLGTVRAGPIAPDAWERFSIYAAAPASADNARLTLVVRWSSTDSDGLAEFRNARLMRDTADPIAYADPHVVGAGQVGETLVTAGWPASRRNLLAAGDSFRAGGSGPTFPGADALTPLLVAAETVSSDANGDATIALDAAIGVGNDPADGAALRLGEG